jgi:serine/threonine protein phosphatase PrpC
MDGMIRASFGLTETGVVRHENQDSYLLDPANGLFAVADGLGGLTMGEKASRLTLEVLKRRLNENPGASLLQTVTETNEEIRDVGYSMAASGFGTTLTVARTNEEGKLLQLAHVGDSAAYLVHGDKLEVLTREHTVAARMMDDQWMDASEAIPLSAHHTLTQCIGQDLYIDPQVAEFPIQGGDRLFLLTDGVIKPLPEGVLHAILCRREPVASIGQSLSFKVEAAGSPDNYTIIAIEFA